MHATSTARLLTVIIILYNSPTFPAAGCLALLFSDLNALFLNRHITTVGHDCGARLVRFHFMPLLNLSVAGSFSHLIVGSG